MKSFSLHIQLVQPLLPYSCFSFCYHDGSVDNFTAEVASKESLQQVISHVVPLRTERMMQLL